MVTKAGALIHVADQVLVERAQTIGADQINRNSTKVYEVGNYRGVATIFDIPDLQFTVDSYDSSAALEALICHTTPSPHVPIDLSTCLPIDVIGQLKKGRTADSPYDVNYSIAVPYLYASRMAYQFGISDLARQTATLNGDSIFYNPGAAYIEEFDGTNAADQVCSLANEAYQYNGDTLTGTRYALGVSLSDGTRLRFGVDYTETVGSVTSGHASVDVTVLAAVPTTEKIRIVYTSDTPVSYPQSVHTLDTPVKPAAIRGYQIEVFVGAILDGDDGEDAADPTMLWTSVQQVSVDWSVTLDKNEEFGNTQVVSQDFDIPAVSGSIQIRPRDMAEFLKRARQAGGVATANEVAGPLNTVPLPIIVRLHAPQDGTILKDLYIPDARFTIPPYSGQANSKLEYTIPFESDLGQLFVVPGGLVQEGS